MVTNLKILVLSYLASMGFGVTFRITGKENLLLAGLGGLFTRAIYLLAQFLIPNRFLYTMIGSFAAATYGELMARKKHVPAVYFTYPSLIPLIPGDLFHFTISSLISGNISGSMNYAGNCLIALLGLCIGMMLSSTTIQSIRKGPVDDD